MSGHVGFSVYMSKIKAKYGECEKNDSLVKLKIDLKEFSDFVSKEFCLGDKEKKILKYSLTKDMTLRIVYDSFIG
jgi:hypothetical protein